MTLKKNYVNINDVVTKLDNRIKYSKKHLTKHPEGSKKRYVHETKIKTIESVIRAIKDMPSINMIEKESNYEQPTINFKENVKVGSEFSSIPRRCNEQNVSNYLTVNCSYVQTIV